ncbi:hypothetical protein LSTR_LSTR003864 [Laodelphax striatellus]|uniref:Uncharacterized protein n=1 Tax=Laodelphax striatellus TaxID=195883 RepID=A0A482XEB1_LAOST|nr:hypothetical protein LSTR_LSTR003864 [Laodelphax striatellus]
MQSDDDDSSLASSKNLASLFEKNSSHGGNSSLMYKPPKQPKIKTESSPRTPARPQAKAKETLSLIMLKVVQTYKFMNNAYVDQGRVGVAISGNPSTRQYQLTLYKEKTSLMAQAQINSQFWFAVQPNNYATFRDRNNILWSLLFASSSSLIEFSTEIALAKWACTESIDTVVSHDLYCVTFSADEKKVASDSRVELSMRFVKISPAYKLVKEIDTSNKHIVNVSKSESWTECLVGSVKGNKKLMILPLHLQGKWKSSLQENERLAFEIEILAVDPPLTLDNSLPKDIPRSSPETTTTTLVREETLPKISDNASNSSAHAQLSLISRMAKVGQALPFKGARVPDVLDSEDEVTATRPLEQSHEHIEEPKSNSVTDQSEVSIVQENAPLPSLPTQQVLAPVAPSSVAATSVPLDSQFAVFFSELRTNNSELRMGMNRITDKLERVMDKMELSSLDRVIDLLRSMETNMVSQFNTAQQKNVELIHTLKEDKYRNPTEFQQQNSVEHLMRENKELQESLAQCTLRAQELQVNIFHFFQNLTEQLMKEKQTRETIEQEHASVMIRLQTQLSEQAKTIALWSEALDKVTQRVPELERKVERERRKVDSEKQRTIRRLMNDVYKKMCSQFQAGDDSARYSAAEIRDTIRDTIKETTFEYLNAQSKQYSREDVNKKEVESIPSVSSTSKTVEEQCDNANREYNLSLKEQDSPSQSGNADKDKAETNESFVVERNIKVEECKNVGDSMEKTPSSSVDKEKDKDDTNQPSDNGQNILFQKRNEQSDKTWSDQCSTEETNKVTGEPAEEITEEDWSPKHPPPLFNNEESESDDSWLN